MWFSQCKNRISYTILFFSQIVQIIHSLILSTDLISCVIWYHSQSDIICSLILLADLISSAVWYCQQIWYHAWFVQTIQAECWEKNLAALTCWDSCDETSWSYLKLFWSSFTTVRKTWSFIYLSFWYTWFYIECQITLFFYNSQFSTHFILYEILLHCFLLSELKTVILESALNKNSMTSDEVFTNEKLR